MLHLSSALAALASAILVFLPSAVAAQSQGLPSRAETERVCQFVADDQLALRGALLMRGLFDANNDGVVEDVGYQAFTGTYGGGDYSIKTREGQAIQIRRMGFEWKDYMSDGGGWLPYDGRTYYVVAKPDGRYLMYLSYITPANEEHILCEFTHHVEEQIFALAPADQDLCAQLAEGKVTFVSVEPIALTAPQDGRRWIAIHGGYAIASDERRWTFVEGKASADFDNDGDEEEMSRYLYASGAGRGCEYEYYDLLGGSDVAAGNLSKRGLLMKVQRVDPDARYPGPHCAGNFARWFTFEGRTYFDTRYKGQHPSHAKEEFHETWVIENMQVRQVCGARFTLKNEVARYNPVLRIGQ